MSHTLTPTELNAAICATLGENLNAMVRQFIDREAKDPAGDLSEAWSLIEKHAGEAFHRFSLYCHAGQWECGLSDLHHSGSCSSASEAMMQALLLDHFRITFDTETQDFRRIEP